MSLPSFPEFLPIIDTDPSVIDTYTSKLPPYSDFVYSNMWSWNIDQSFKASDLHGNLVMFMRDPKTKETFFSIHGTNKINESLSELFDTLEEVDAPLELNLVPEETAQIIDKSLFSVQQERDYYDYIFSTERLTHLEGKSFKSKRNLINQFLSHHTNWSVEHSLLTPDVKMGLLRFMSEENRKRSKLGYYPFVEYEMAALERFFLLPENNNLFVSTLRIDGEVVGYSVDEIVSHSCALSHFFKVSIDFKGAYDVLNRETARFLFEHGTLYWNWVEDLGLEGLRKAKLAYRPVAFLRVYSVTR